MNKKIISTHIENDVVNGSPTLVFTDEDGEEWVHEEQTSNYGGYITKLVKKQDSWFFKDNDRMSRIIRNDFIKQTINISTTQP